MTMVTGVLMSGGAPVPLPDHSSHSTDLDSEAAANTERRCAGPEPRDCAPRSAVCLRAPPARRACQLCQCNVPRFSSSLLPASRHCPARGRGSLASILSSFSSSLTQSSVPTNKSMTRILSKLAISRCLKA